MNFIFFYLVFVAKGLFYIYSLEALSVYSDMIGQNSNCIQQRRGFNYTIKKRETVERINTNVRVQKI